MMLLTRIVICTVPRSTPYVARFFRIRGRYLLELIGDRYYEGGVSSVYMWDLDDGIAGVVLFKKGTSGFD